MQLSFVLIVHICSGIVGLLSGAAAISFRKGSQRHRATGNVFVVSMLILAASGAYLGVTMHQPTNILGGTLTFYLIASAWMTARHSNGKTSTLEWGAFAFALTLGTVSMILGLLAAMDPTVKHGNPAGGYFFVGIMTLLCSAGDLRMLRRGISDTERIARHLWRMCYGLFVASASIFLARQHIFPVLLRKTGVLTLLSFLPLILMFFWLIRVRSKDAYDKPAPGSGDAYPLQT